MCWRKRKLPSFDRGETGAEAAAEAERVALVLHVLLDALPLHPKGWIGEHVVEGAARMAVLGERVAGHDVERVLALEHHVRPADGIGLVVQLLAEDLEARTRVQVAEVILGDGEHPAGSASRVEERPHYAGLAEEAVVLDEEEVHHQPNDLARREVLAGGLVREL
jgi:hypothetical protein